MEGSRQEDHLSPRLVLLHLVPLTISTGVSNLNFTNSLSDLQTVT